MTDQTTEPKKPEIRILPEELAELKKLFSAIRNAQINVQVAGLAYEQECLKLATKYGVGDEQYVIDRLTGMITIQPGKLPGAGSMMQR